MLIQYISQYLEYLEIERGLADNTLLAYRSDLYSLSDFLLSIDVQELSSISRMHLNMYIKSLYDKKYTPRSITREIASIKGFFKWLSISEYISHNPALAVEQPKLPKRLPKVLSMKEINELLSSGMSILDKEQQVDTYSHITHAVPHCISNELFKNVLNDHSVGAFSGRILVKEEAQKTEAYQTNRNLCATREARMYSKPQLEIYADDVKCSHGMTTGQIDENALFYMQSRGISREEARMLLSVAFTSDVIDHVRLDALKDRLHILVEKRFRGELAKCAGCRICK